MAFLCPVRIRRSKKKGDVPPPNFLNPTSAPSSSSPGRITGSSSIETLVRVGVEKEAGVSASARMTVLHDFSPCVDDELSVHRGDIVSLLYREHDWAYVIDSKIPPSEGFIPFTYISPLAPNNNPPNVISLKNNENIENRVPFSRNNNGELVLVLFCFEAEDEGDLGVGRGEVVRVLNSEDKDWLWVKNTQGDEGFVPSSFVSKLDCLEEDIRRKLTTNFTNNCINDAKLSENSKHTSNNNNVLIPTHETSSNKHTNSGLITNNENSTNTKHSTSSTGSGLATSSNETSKFSHASGLMTSSTKSGLMTSSTKSGLMTNSTVEISTEGGSNSKVSSNGSSSVELVMLYDYKAQAADDLSVRRGDWIHADLSEKSQTVAGWLWAYGPKQKRYGFIPRAYARLPPMTSL